MHIAESLSSFSFLLLPVIIFEGCNYCELDFLQPEKESSPLGRRWRSAKVSERKDEAESYLLPTDKLSGSGLLLFKDKSTLSLEPTEIWCLEMKVLKVDCEHLLRVNSELECSIKWEKSLRKFETGFLDESCSSPSDLRILPATLFIYTFKSMYFLYRFI
jgi:hypothetical protein